MITLDHGKRRIAVNLAIAAMLSLSLSIGFTLAPTVASAVTGDIGYAGPSASGDGSAATGELVVMASNDATQQYRHADIALGSS